MVIFSGMKLLSLLALPLLSLSVAAVYPTRLVYQDPTGLFIENLAVRASGQLLITSPISPTLHSLDPTRTNASLAAVHTFPNCSGLMGIIEYQPDAFALVTATIDLTTRRAAAGSVTVWSIAFSPIFSIPLVRRVAVVSNSSILDGLSIVPGSPHLVLAADPGAGTVWQINMATGATHLAIQDPSMAPGAPAPALGINGLHMKDGFLYYSNSQATTFTRMPLGLSASGNMGRAGKTAAQLLSTVEPAGEDHQYDDFAFDKQGRAWVATHTGAVTLITQQGDGSFAAQMVAGSLVNASLFEEPSSAQFGRGSAKQEALLYVSTAAGQIIAVDTSAPNSK
ncbi:hypothetical protein FB45DRAFT_1103101 [Roridomyces roridus]|uniref:SMP-30/Gluconolactonase/LRE-like region domain-containing protein n=1 Tax=Roridomyces roridus TaxID=1738132 RepID=A0AAD7FFY8_9AGAR|nr:hypothetical protein FB45DRAFT_1103101 [Roridomyces roridus]